MGKDDSSYWVHPSAQGFRGENSRHALSADFTKQGAEIRSHNLSWTLQTRAYGYGNALHSAKPVAPQANANRVEYRRDGLTEWYENGPLGLEQGFALPHRPGKTNGKPLTFELALRGVRLFRRGQRHHDCGGGSVSRGRPELRSGSGVRVRTKRHDMEPAGGADRL